MSRIAANSDTTMKILPFLSTHKLTVTFIERFVHSFIFGLCLMNPCPCFQWHA